MRTHPTRLHDTLGGDRQEVIKLIEQLATAMIYGQDRQSCIAACDELVTFAVDYFAMENTLMSRQGNPRNSLDEEENNRFVAYVNDLRERFNSESVIVTSEALNTLFDGLKSHIQRSDRSLGGASSELPAAVGDELPLPRGAPCTEQGDRRLWQTRQRFRRRATDSS